jgi:hypothetical protein
MSDFLRLKKGVKRLAMQALLTLNCVELDYPEGFPVNQMQRYDEEANQGSYLVYRTRPATLSEIKKTLAKTLDNANRQANNKNFNLLNKLIEAKVVKLNFAMKESWENLTLYFVNMIEARKAAKAKYENEIRLKELVRDQLKFIQISVKEQILTSLDEFWDILDMNKSNQFILSNDHTEFLTLLPSSAINQPDRQDYQYVYKVHTAKGLGVYYLYLKFVDQGDIKAALDFVDNKGIMQRFAVNTSLDTALATLVKSLKNMHKTDKTYQNELCFDYFKECFDSCYIIMPRDGFELEELLYLCEES